MLESKTIATIREIGGDSLLAELGDIFLAGATRRIAALRSACEQGDLDAVSRWAYSLRSIAGSLGASTLVGVAASIEQSACAGRRDALAPLLAEADRSLVEVRAALAAERGA